MFLSKISCLMVMFGYSSAWIINNVDLQSLEGKDLLIKTKETKALKTFSLIYPDTKWCGVGNIADGYDDLGPARETDMCCREHDLCPDIIPGGKSCHGLTNDAFYTRVHCDCEEQFRLCLRAANSKVAQQIGTVYFNALSTQCYREDYPVIGCNKFGGLLNNKCLKPDYDMKGKRRYQWFSVPNY